MQDPATAVLPSEIGPKSTRARAVPVLAPPGLSVRRVSSLQGRATLTRGASAQLAWHTLLAAAELLVGVLLVALVLVAPLAVLLVLLTVLGQWVGARGPHWAHRAAGAVERHCRTSAHT